MTQPVSFVAFPQLVDPTKTTAIVPAQVASLSPVPAALLVPPTPAGTIVTFEDGTEVAVVGTVAAVGAALAAAVVGSSLVLLPSLADPAVSLAIQGARVSALVPVPAQLLVPPVTDGTRIVYEDGTERAVVGTVAATAAALTVAPPPPIPPVIPPFGTQYLLQTAAQNVPSSTTNSAAPTPVPGALVTIPAGGAGDWLVNVSGAVGSNTPATDGVRAAILLNGAEVAGPLQIPGGATAATTAVWWFSQWGLFGGLVVGDTLGAGFRATPGGGVPLAIAASFSVTAWRVNP